MTSIRTLAAVLGLLSFCACAAAQSVTRTGGSVNFTHTGVVTRVPVGLPLVDAKGSQMLFDARGVVGADLVCFRPSSGTPAPSDGGKLGPDRDPGDLKAALLDQVYGKTSAGLSGLLANVNSAPGRNAKLRELFGIQLLAPLKPPVYLYSLNDAQIRQLQMGQEVNYAQPTSISSGPPGSPGQQPRGERCYTTAQLDNAIAEGTRVVGELIRALQAPN